MENKRRKLKRPDGGSFFVRRFKCCTTKAMTQRPKPKHTFVIELTPDRKYKITCPKNEKKKVRTQLARYDQHAVTTDRLDELPINQLETILRYINVWHYSRIRDASQFFRQLHDNHLLHTFNQALETAKKHMPQGNTTLKLKALKTVAHYYIQAGYVHIFCGCLLPLMRHCYHHPFRFDDSSMAHFIGHFSHLIDEQVRGYSNYVGVLLYTLTFLRLFMLFPNKNTHWYETEDGTFVIRLVLSNCWKNSIESLDNFNSNHMSRFALIVLLAQMLIANPAESSECVLHNNNERTNTSFQLSIKGSPHLSSLAQHVASGGDYVFSWPTADTPKNFTIVLRIGRDIVGYNSQQNINIMSVYNSLLLCSLGSFEF